jgi:hypothetical protein
MKCTGTQVHELKTAIAELKSHAVQQITLIYNGKVLADALILNECGIRPTEFIVCMLKQGKKVRIPIVFHDAYQTCTLTYV